MNYAILQNLAYAYADRQDQETLDRYDDFLRIVESRVNQMLHVGQMTCRTRVKLLDGVEYYGLPDDFHGIRDIEAYNETTETPRITLEMLNPRQFNDKVSEGIDRVQNREMYYSLVAQQVQVFPPRAGMVMEIIYYRKVPALTIANITNWLSEEYPDVYLFGLCVEISSFAKDAVAASLWDKRYMTAIDQVIGEDAETRWSGPTMRTRIG